MKTRILGMMVVLFFAVSLSSCNITKQSGKQDNEQKSEKKINKQVAGTAQKFGKLKEFTAKTLDKKEFGPSEFEKYDLTIINFWSTWCGPCVAEMPELAEFAKKLPKNVQFITVCLDGNTEAKEAGKILKKAGFSGTTLVKGNDDFSIVCDRIQYTPTTILVDAEGNLIGDELIGVQDDTQMAYLSYVNDALKRMDKEEITLE